MRTESIAASRKSILSRSIVIPDVTEHAPLLGNRTVIPPDGDFVHFIRRKICRSDRPLLISGQLEFS
jgi:hypothetical protein